MTATKFLASYFSEYPKQNEDEHQKQIHQNYKRNRFQPYQRIKCVYLRAHGLTRERLFKLLFLKNIKLHQPIPLEIFSQ